MQNINQSMSDMDIVSDSSMEAYMDNDGQLDIEAKKQIAQSVVEGFKQCNSFGLAKKSGLAPGLRLWEKQQILAEAEQIIHHSLSFFDVFGDRIDSDFEDDLDSIIAYLDISMIALYLNLKEHGREWNPLGRRPTGRVCAAMVYQVFDQTQALRGVVKSEAVFDPAQMVGGKARWENAKAQFDAGAPLFADAERKQEAKKVWEVFRKSEIMDDIVPVYEE